MRFPHTCIFVYAEIAPVEFTVEAFRSRPLGKVRKCAHVRWYHGVSHSPQLIARLWFIALLPEAFGSFQFLVFASQPRAPAKLASDFDRVRFRGFGWMARDTSPLHHRRRTTQPPTEVFLIPLSSFPHFSLSLFFPRCKPIWHRSMDRSHVTKIPIRDNQFRASKMPIIVIESSLRYNNEF